MTVEIEDDSQIYPAFAGPDVADVPSPFLLRPIRSEVLIQHIGPDVERMVAIGCGLVFLCPDDLDAVFAHQTAHTPVTDVQPQLLQFFSHPWAPIALQAQARLLTDMGQNTISSRCRWLIGPFREARNSREVTCMIPQRNSTDQTHFHASMKANLTGFDLQKRSPPFLVLAFSP